VRLGNCIFPIRIIVGPSAGYLTFVGLWSLTEVDSLDIAEAAPKIGQTLNWKTDGKLADNLNLTAFDM
jgi:hypothetical protein